MKTFPLRTAFVGLALAAGPLCAQDAPPQAPAMPEAPHSFSLAAVGVTHEWTGDGAFGETTDGEPAVGLEIESRVFDYLAFRGGFTYSSPRIRSADRGLEANQYTVEVMAVGRLPIVVAGRGVTPLATVGYGSLVQAPGDDALRTRNQSFFTWGAGAELEVVDRLGVRAEWRHADVQRASIFDPGDRSSSEVSLERWVLGVYWRF